jgi:tetratricopeptide (TPR) repeat protein
MILTTCPVCAAPLPPTSAKQCSRCKTRYCGPACQKKHWEEGGHDKLCRKIRKGGGAEQFYADKKYAEAVGAAAEECAEETKGQTCYICTQALHWKTKEGLVRGCACRGTAGFAHVSCLAEQAKILWAEAEENNLGAKMRNARWDRWSECSLCEQSHHGVVRCALGWACWKTYLGRPETDSIRCCAIGLLGTGLSEARHHEDALTVKEAELSTLRRIVAPEEYILVVQSNLATTYEQIGRRDEALSLRREAYSGYLKLRGEEHEDTLISASNYAGTLVLLKRYQETKTLFRKKIPVARRVLGENHAYTLRLRWNYASALFSDDAASLDDLREAATTLEDVEQTARRVFGGAHPLAVEIERDLRNARAALRAREAPST